MKLNNLGRKINFVSGSVRPKTSKIEVRKFEPCTKHAFPSYLSCMNNILYFRLSNRVKYAIAPVFYYLYNL